MWSWWQFRMKMISFVISARSFFTGTLLIATICPVLLWMALYTIPKVLASNHHEWNGFSKVRLKLKRTRSRNPLPRCSRSSKISVGFLERSCGVKVKSSVVSSSWACFSLKSKSRKRERERDRWRKESRKRNEDSNLASERWLMRRSRRTRRSLIYHLGFFLRECSATLTAVKTQKEQKKNEKKKRKKFKPRCTIWDLQGIFVRTSMVWVLCSDILE